MSRPPITREPGDSENNAPLHLCLNAMSILKVWQYTAGQYDDSGVPTVLIRTGTASKRLGCTWPKLITICKQLGVPLIQRNRRRYIPLIYLERIRDTLNKES